MKLSSRGPTISYIPRHRNRSRRRFPSEDFLAAASLAAFLAVGWALYWAAYILGWLN